MPCRLAIDDDRHAIRELRRAWTDEDGPAGDDPGFEQAFDEWWATEAGHRRHFVAEADGRIVGIASVVTMVRMPRPGRPTRPWGYVHQVFVLASHRGRGVGAELLRFLIDDCRAAGFERLVLHPTEPSVRFYERLGFGPATHLLQLELERV